MFKGDYYYPNGGSSDYNGTYDSLEQAESIAVELDICEWSEIVVVDTEGVLYPHSRYTRNTDSRIMKSIGDENSALVEYDG